MKIKEIIEKIEMLQGQKDAFEAGSKLGYEHGIVAQKLAQKEESK